MIVSVTGANGMVGYEVCKYLLNCGFTVRAIVRHGSVFLDLISNNKFELIFISDISSKDELITCLQGSYCVIHCASKVHVSENSHLYSDFHNINVCGASALSEAAIVAKVEKVIFISTVAVYGINSNNRDPFTEVDIPNPIGSYAISKFYAEEVLTSKLGSSSVKLIIIRCPLILGARVVGNIKKMLWLISLRIPLPLKCINNKRSIVSISNLLDFIEVILTKKIVVEGVFNISDGEDYSTPTLILKIASIKQLKVKLFSFPLRIIFPLLYLVRKDVELNKFTDNFQVNISKAKSVLDWNPKQINCYHCEG